MANIDVQRRETSIWPWLLGLIVLGLLIWGAMELFGGGTEETTYTESAPAVVESEPSVITPETTTPMATTPTTGLTIAQILQNPTAHIGHTFSGAVQVTEVPTDRGFWVTDQGQRIFVIINGPAPDQPKNIQANQMVQLNNAQIYGTEQLATLPGTLDADTRQLAQQQQAVLFVEEQNLTIQGQ